MNNGTPLLKSLRAALEREPLINLHRWPIQASLLGDDALLLEGDTGSIAAKKRILEIACGLHHTGRVVDRLHVAPAEHKGDGAIIDSLKTLLLGARELKSCTLRVMKKGQAILLQEAHGDYIGGHILISVKDGVIMLDGSVISLTHKRLAGVLAWWTPGCRDVENRLEVDPREQDNDGEVSDALALVLEIDPMIPDPAQIRVTTDHWVVTLDGLVANEAERNRAEQDAWSLFAVDKVINRLAVGA